MACHVHVHVERPRDTLQPPPSPVADIPSNNRGPFNVLPRTYGPFNVLPRTSCGVVVFSDAVMAGVTAQGINGGVLAGLSWRIGRTIVHLHAPMGVAHGVG